MGNRIAKHITNNQTNLLEKSTYYILDAQGNTLNTYDHEVTDNAVLYTLKERQIYGSSRLGIYNDSVSMYITNQDDYVNKEKGHKFYELSNHLGNVLTVISDKKIPQMVTVKTLDFETPITESFDYADVCVPEKLFYEADQFSGHTYEVDAKGNTVYKIDGLPHSVQYSLDGLTPGESYTIAGRFIENNTNVAVTVRSCENSSILVNTSFKSAGDFTVRFIAPYENVSITFLSLGGVWSADDISFSGKGLGSNEICYLADIVNIADYSPFGVQLDGRTITSEKYRYGFNGMEKDDEVKGEGNSYDFGARMYDSRVGRWLSVDPLTAQYNDMSPYNFVGNSPIQAFDPDGELIIWVNGEAPKEEKADQSYWAGPHKLVNYTESFRYRIGEVYEKNWFRNGDQTSGKYDPFDSAGGRKENGIAAAKVDFEALKSSLKSNMKDGKITETIKIISHSKGGAYANGYANTLGPLLEEWRNSEPELFAGDGGTIELVVHLAPHQSNFIDVDDSTHPTVGICHDYDGLSGNDITGDAINIQTETPAEGTGAHSITGFWNQLDKVYDQLKANSVAGKDKYTGMDGLLDNQTDYDDRND